MGKAFTWKEFSEKQLKVLSWWMSDSPYKDLDGIICEGSVRAGKTLSNSFAFVDWSMTNFDGVNFILSGKTIESFRRNVLKDLKKVILQEGYTVQEKRKENLIIISNDKTENHYYIFGGKDEGSQDLVQGVTAAGAFFDEVALMPESFVNQAIARCSIEGAKLWFNCNPGSPFHWFKLGWIDKAKEKKMYHLHFTMDDNLSLSEKVKERYRRSFFGVFFQRFILGLWVMAEGIIYDMFSEEKNCIEEKDLPRNFDYYVVSMDYGTVNPFAAGLAGIKGDTIYIIKEYYFDSKKAGRQKTDSEYSKDIQEFTKETPCKYKIVDPSAASFILQMRKDGIPGIMPANNAVLDGIRSVSSALAKGKIKIVKKNCPNLIKEFSSYVWDEKAQQHGEDKPIKQFDHCCDFLRYLIFTLFRYYR
jgi:PBSX family phage terminase large subunit